MPRLNDVARPARLAPGVYALGDYIMLRQAVRGAEAAMVGGNVAWFVVTRADYDAPDRVPEGLADPFRTLALAAEWVSQQPTTTGPS